MMGDLLEVVSGSDLTIRCRIVGAEGCQLHLLNMEDEFRLPIEAEEFSIERRVRVERATFFRVEVRGQGEDGQRAMVALSNPIYIRLRGETRMWTSSLIPGKVGQGG
jgi:hypothetical protein